MPAACSPFMSALILCKHLTALAWVPPVGRALGRGQRGQGAPVDDAVHQLRSVHVACKQPGDLGIAQPGRGRHSPARLGRRQRTQDGVRLRLCIRIQHHASLRVQ